MNTLPPLPLIDGALFVDNSGWIESMSTCNRLAQYKNLNKRIGAGEKPALNFGSAIHLGLEYRYAKYKNGPVDDAYYNDMAAILTDFYNEHPVPLDDWRGLNWTMTLLRKYNEKNITEGWNLLAYDTPIDCPQCGGETAVSSSKCLWCQGTGKREAMVELAFGLPLFTWKGELWFDEAAATGGPYKKHLEIPIIYTGRIDLPISIDGQIFVMDHKTTGMLGSSFFDAKRLSSQQRGYCWAFQELAKKPVAGYVINAIRTKEPPQYVTAGGERKSTSKTTNPQTWWEESFQREKFLLQPGQLDEWKQNVISLIEEFLWHYSRGYMPMRTGNEHACVNYGKCQFFDVCRLHSDDRGMMLASGLFMDNVWSPLKEPTQPKQNQ